jgi:diguanylate cyclase (GGDEF)-like protein
MSSLPKRSETVGGVRDPLRLAAVARAELRGHLGDPDLNSIVATLRIACRVPIAVVNIVSENCQTYPAEVGVGAPCTTVPDELSFCAEVVETKRTLAVSDATAHPIYADNPLVVAGVVAAYAGVPLVDAGYVLGSVSIFDGRPRVFTSDELEVLHHQARLASSVLALRRIARTDVLTGLPNRQMLFDRLAFVLARNGRNDSLAAVMYLDLDGFKALNDSCGHGAGDRLLVDLAVRWTAALRADDTLSRVGGDEFVAVCEDMASIDDATAIADRLIEAVRQAAPVDPRFEPVTVSIGIALVSSPLTDPAAVLQAADLAMYRAKASRGSTRVVA